LNPIRNSPDRIEGISSVSDRSFLPIEWVSLKRDPNTGLGTLISLFERLESLQQYTWSEGKPLSLLHIDIDRLAKLNRSLGYSIVDEMIIHLVHLIQTLLHKADLADTSEELFYRIGGDEFAIVLPDVELDAALEFAEEVRSSFSESFPPDATLNATISVGVASIPGNARDLGSLITVADMGVLGAKGKGGNAVFGQSDTEKTSSYEFVVSSRIINMLARRMVETGMLLEEAQHAAFTDPISGLPNHRALDHFLRHEHMRATRYNRCYSILLADGDSLKEFNDRLSHDAGNEWIRRLSRVLVRQTRATDLVARWFSGDEFVIVLTETNMENAIITAERIRKAVEAEGREMPIAGTVSIGLASFPEDGATFEELLKVADQANSEAKRRGRNCVVCYQEMLGETESLDNASELE
jgi:diguanylate cyclase (GGDEF)-like protein